MERQYKDSGIEWIGAVPEFWQYKRFKYSGVFEKGKLPLSSNIERIGLPIIGASEMLGKDARTYTSDQSVPRCKEDDILILWDGANAGITSSGLNGVVSSTAVKYTCKDKDILPKYVAYLLKYAEHYFKEKVNGTTIPHMNMAYINDIPLLCPSLHEQQRIVDYLDEKCGELDSLIELQEQMIEKLKAYKQSVITEAVTKGLDPNANLVSSCIDWIGEIPEGWAVVPLKSILQRRTEKNNPVKTKERLSLSIDKGVTLYAEKTTNLDRFKDDFTQYQLAYPNDIVLNSMNMIVGAVGLSNYYGCVSPVYYVVYSKSANTDIKYYSYLLNTQRIRDVYHSLGQGIYAIERGEGRVNTCRLKVSYDDFGVLRIPVPPLFEQQAIASYLDEKCVDIDRLIDMKQQKIEKLKDYKKSVIYEAVTGKINIES
jgi:type I restriction enzyme S subunit